MVGISLASTAAEATGFDVNDAVMNSVIAFMADKNCPNLHINPPLMTKFLRFYGIEVADIGPGGKFHANAEAFTKKFYADYAEGPKAFCMAASSMFAHRDPKLLIED